MRNEQAVPTDIGTAVAGPRLRLAGTVASVVIAPIGAALTLEAELEDGTGRVSLLWLGRRQVLGVRPGRRLEVCGRLTMRDGRRVLFNPDYTLLP